MTVQEEIRDIATGSRKELISFIQENGKHYAKVDLSNMPKTEIAKIVHAINEVNRVAHFKKYFNKFFAR